MSAAMRMLLAVVLAAGLIGAATGYTPRLATAITLRGTVFAGTVTCTADNSFVHKVIISASQTEEWTWEEHARTTFILAQGKPILGTGMYSSRYTTKFTDTASDVQDRSARTVQGSFSGSIVSPDDFNFEPNVPAQLSLLAPQIPVTATYAQSHEAQGKILAHNDPPGPYGSIAYPDRNTPLPVLTVSEDQPALSGGVSRDVIDSTTNKVDGHDGCTWSLIVVVFNGKPLQGGASSGATSVTPTKTPTPTASSTQIGEQSPTDTPTATPSDTTGPSDTATATATPMATAQPVCGQSSIPGGHAEAMSSAGAGTACIISHDVKAVALIDQVLFNPLACIGELKANPVLSGGLAGEAARSKRISSAALKLERDFAHDWLLATLTFAGGVVTQAPSEIVEACGGLYTSANWWPPSTFDAKSWARFKADQEYRGYVHIPRMFFQVRNGKIVGRAQLLDAGDQPEHSYGYTKLAKIPFNAGVKDRAKPYLPMQNPGNPFQRPNFTMQQFPTKLVLRSWIAARLGRREQELNYKWFGLDAPFIFLDLTETVSVTGGRVTTTVQLKRSEFPSAYLYIDDQQVGRQPQDHLVDFMLHGGSILHAPGVGPLAPAGPPLAWPL
jgi:hypothetical protein